MKEHYIFKIVLGGDGAVGKTTLIHRYIKGYFIDDIRLTIGVEFFQSEININNGQKCTLIIWDLGGQAQFRRLLKHYIIGASAGLLLFDMSRPKTVFSIPEWVKLFRMDQKDMPILLAGSKADLTNQIDFDQNLLNDIIEEYHFLDYMKSSAKLNLNIKEIFHLIAEQLVYREEKVKSLYLG